VQQARYIRTLVKPGHTVEEVAEDIKLTAGEIRNFLRTDTMMQLAHVMPLEDDVREILDDKDKFSLTTLERLIQSSDGQKFLGITFDADGNAVGGYEAEGDSHQIWRIQIIQVTVTSLRLFLRSSTGPNRAFQPQSLGRVRDPVRIAEGPTATDAATQRHFGFRLRLVDKLRPIGGGSGRGRPLSGTWEK